MSAIGYYCDSIFTPESTEKVSSSMIFIFSFLPLSRKTFKNVFQYRMSKQNEIHFYDRFYAETSFLHEISAFFDARERIFYCDNFRCNNYGIGKLKTVLRLNWKHGSWKNSYMKSISSRSVEKTCCPGEFANPPQFVSKKFR